jgi:GxxExxY protein
MNVEDIVKKILDSIYCVRGNLVQGYLESLYEKALIIELQERGLKVESQVPVQVNYKGTIIGDFKIDLLVEDCVIIEIKAVQNLQVAHELQLVNYLTIAKKDIAILVNFGGDKIEIKRKYRLYTPKK